MLNCTLRFDEKNRAHYCVRRKLITYRKQNYARIFSSNKRLHSTYPRLTVPITTHPRPGTVIILSIGIKNGELTSLSPTLKGCLISKNFQLDSISRHTIRKCKKMAGQNTFKILLLNDANMIGEHQETRMKMPNMGPSI